MRYVKSAVWRVSSFLHAKGTVPVLEGPTDKGTFEEFLAKLLTVESGLDPSKFAAYVRDYESPVMWYPRVAAPGRVIRDRVSGNPQFVRMTVGEYFAALGVHDLFDPSSPACIHAMQYAATNALGFVGYQFGESALISSGYYRPQIVHVRDGRGRAREYESYYFGSVLDTAWRAGRTEILYRIPGTDRTILATDVNRWRGTFTGRDGIWALADLKDPARQEAVIRNLLRANHTALVRLLSVQRPSVATTRYTWSGLLAAAHLCGARAAAAFVLTGKRAEDEFKTKIETYFAEFSGFETPYDSAPLSR